MQNGPQEAQTDGLVRKVLLLSVCIAIHAACSRPASYEDCVLRNVKDGMSDEAVVTVTRICRTQFPSVAATKPKDRPLEPSELRSLTGRAGPQNGGRYGGTLYNGNGHLLVKDVRLRITTTTAGEESGRTYRIENIEFPPLTATSFSFGFVEGDTGAEHSWRIESARALSPRVDGEEPGDAPPYETAEERVRAAVERARAIAEEYRQRVRDRLDADTRRRQQKEQGSPEP